MTKHFDNVGQALAYFQQNKAITALTVVSCEPTAFTEQDGYTFTTTYATNIGTFTSNTIDSDFSKEHLRTDNDNTEFLQDKFKKVLTNVYTDDIMKVSKGLTQVYK